MSRMGWLHRKSAFKLDGHGLRPFAHPTLDKSPTIDGKRPALKRLLQAIAGERLTLKHRQQTFKDPSPTFDDQRQTFER